MAELIEAKDKMPRTFILLVLFLFLPFSSFAQEKQSIAQAKQDANADLRTGNFKLYQGGTEACILYGVNWQEYQNAPQEIKGKLKIVGECGCTNPKAIHPDFSEKYAKTYNRIIWSHLNKTVQ